MTTEVLEDTLQRLKGQMPETFSMSWLDEHRDDVIQVLEGMPLQTAARELGISRSGLRNWRERRGLVEAPTPPAGPAGAETIGLDLIDENPWQPRKTMEPEALAQLAGSIATSGLLQVPVGRRTEDGRVQLAFGHRRVEAIRLLVAEDRWEGGAPVQVKELSDHQMALIALEENAKRKDITPLEQWRGYQRVIDDGLMNITQLADSVGLDRTTISNSLRILRLPKVALQQFEAGNLKTPAARALLSLTAPDHDHKDDIESVIRRINRDRSGNAGYGYMTGSAPDWSLENVRMEIDHQVSYSHAQAWRPLWAPPKGDRSGGHVGTNYPLPGFDIKAFEREHPTKVHYIHHGGKTRAWTCHVKEWRRLQSAATREATKDAKEGPASMARMGDAEAKAFATAMLRDPVVQAAHAGTPVASGPPTVSAETPPQQEPDEKGLAYKRLNEWVEEQAEIFVEVPVPGVGDVYGILEDLGLEELLTEEEAHRAIERAIERIAASEGYDEEEEAAPPPAELDGDVMPGWDAIKDKLGSRARYLRLDKGKKPAFAKQLEYGYNLPDGFDLKMCKEQCTWGASYAKVNSYSSQVYLVCTNEEHYRQMVSDGKKRYAAAVQKKYQHEEATAQAAAWELAADPTRTLRAAALALMMEQGHHAMDKPYGYQDKSTWRQRGTTTRVLEIIGMANPDVEDVSFTPRARGVLDKRIVQAVDQLDAEALRPLVANLIAHTLQRGAEEAIETYYEDLEGDEE